MSDLHRDDDMDAIIERSLSGRGAPISAQEDEVRTQRDVDRAVAALHLAALGERWQPLPGALRERLLAEGRRQIAESATRAISSTPVRRASTGLGWLAAAASLVFALWVWTTRGAPPAEQVASAREARDRMLIEASDAVRLAWSRTEDPLSVDVVGEVVWSDELQEGYMSFKDLPANDPTRNQYQLWIFDPQRPDETPVDGGVFDVPASTAEVVVPIDAKLRVESPKLFAVTLERPGGVVVSKRERLVVLAQKS